MDIRANYLGPHIVHIYFRLLGLPVDHVGESELAEANGHTPLRQSEVGHAAEGM